MQTPTSVIRSFVRREGRFTKAQRSAIKKYWDDYGIDVNKEVINLKNLFKNNFPTVLDIGFGNGIELISIAKQHRDLNFLGVEVYRPGIGSLLNKIVEEGIRNIRVLNVDAVELLKNNIVGESIVSILIWFPDPWPKKRHHKRRLIQDEFIKLIESKLTKDGELYVATDWQPYAEQMQKTIEQSLLFKKISTSRFISARPETKFEKRGLKLGHSVFSQVYKKIN